MNSRMNLHVLPTRTGSAPENMAVDFLMLQRYPNPDAARFRHYDWRRPAATFGYSQKIDEVRPHLPGSARELCRRPTGGGIVDHLNDWTYALVLPRRHPLSSARAAESYRSVHDTIRRTLEALGQPVALMQPGKCPSRNPEICFQRAEPFDVIHAGTGGKVAGAAQKRTNRGLLFQGSLDRDALPGFDWESFGDAFAGELAALLDAVPGSPGWPDFDPEEESALADSYASEEWLARR